MSKRIVIEPDNNGDDQVAFYEDAVLQGTLKMSDLTFWFSRPINDGGKYSFREIENGSSADFTLGDKRYDRAFYIDYVVERGTEYEAGSMTVIFKEGTSFSYSRKSAGDDTGVSFGFSIDGNNIVLTATSTSGTTNPTLKITTKTIGR